MAGRSKILIISGVILVFVILMYFFGRGSSYVTDNWSETYSPTDKGPYGTYMLKELLDTAGLFGDFIHIEDELEKALENETDENDIYFFIGTTSHLKYRDVDYLIDFVADGNVGDVVTASFWYVFGSEEYNEYGY